MKNGSRRSGISRLSAAALAALLLPHISNGAASGEDISAATISLRGGYDSNPANIEGATGGVFLAHAAAWEFLRGTDKDGFGVSLNAAQIVYDPRVIAPTTNHAATFKHAIGLSDQLLLRSTLSAASDQAWSRRQNAILWRERLDYEAGRFRFFAGLDARLASLNERNIFALGGFLPRDESFLTLSALPGLAWRSSIGEVGASLSLARTRYLHETDYLGFFRHNDRLQPNLFASTTLFGVTFEGSASFLTARFPDRNFDDVKRILYTAKAVIPMNQAMITLSSQRTAEETTLPWSVINIATNYEARASLKYDERNRLDIYGRYKSDHYLGLDARANTVTAGFEYQREIERGLTALAAASWRRTKETGANPVIAFNLQIGLQKQFEIGAGKADPDAASRK